MRLLPSDADLAVAREQREPLLALRREDKGPSERRAPLAPPHVAAVAKAGVPIAVESSARRVFADREYERAGARVVPALARPPVVLGVKEPHLDRLVPGAAHLVFAHVTKGQAANMPLLRRFLDLGCTLLDYEQIVDERGRRLVFFGKHAGHAGAINALWALGRRLEAEGTRTPFGALRLAHEYASLDDALAHIREAGNRIRFEGLSSNLRPVVFAIAGSGNVSAGADEVLAQLQPREVGAAELALFPLTRESRREVFVVRLSREDRYRRIGGGAFDPVEYAGHPERYASGIGRLLPHVTVFVNGIYWESGYPRLIDNAHLDALWRDDAQPVLRVIADVTCDVGGSIEANVAATTPEDPVYVFSPPSRRNGQPTQPGVRGDGPVLMTVDNLPAQVPREASQSFGSQLRPFLPELAACDWSAPLEQLRLGPELRRAIITHRGELAPAFAYLHESLQTVTA